MPVEQDPVLYNEAMKEVMEQYRRMVQAGEDVESGEGGEH